MEKSEGKEATRNQQVCVSIHHDQKQGQLKEIQEKKGSNHHKPALSPMLQATKVNIQSRDSLRKKVSHKNQEVRADISRAEQGMMLSY